MRAVRRLWAGSGAALIALAGFGLAPTAAQAADSVVPDPALAACLNVMLDPGRPADQDISVADLASLREVRCTVSGSGVGSLEGLQHATKLWAFTLTGSNSLGAPDALQPLAGITTLRELELANSQLTTIEPLAELVGMTQLAVSGNALTSLAGTEKMSKLTLLTAVGNQLTNLDPLSDLRMLRFLSIGNNTLENLAGIRDANDLAQIWVNDNPTLEGQLDELAGKPSLNNVNISNTGATDLAVFAEYPGMNTFQAIGNHISSLAGIPSGTTKVTLQTVTGKTLYVPVGATSHRIDVTGEVTMEDGVTLPGEIGRPPAGGVEPDPDPEVPFIRVKFGAEGERAVWGFDSTPANRFNGAVTNPIVRVSIDADIPDFTVNKPGAGSVSVSDPGFVVDSEGGWALGEDAPAFLQIDPGAGAVTGTAAAPGEYTFTVSVRDELGNPMERKVTLTVKPADTDPPIDPPVDPPVEPPVDPPVEPPVHPPVAPPTPPVVPPAPGTAPPLAVTGAGDPAMLWALGGTIAIAGSAALLLSRRPRRED